METKVEESNSASLQKTKKLKRKVTSEKETKSEKKAKLPAGGKRKRGKIYKIVNSENDMKYIGHTIQRLLHRFGYHVGCSKNDEWQSPLYVAMRSIGVDNFEIIEIESVLLPVGVTQKECRAILLVHENAHIAKYDPAKLYNIVLDGTTPASAKEKQKETVEKHTDEEKKIVTQRRSQAQSRTGKGKGGQIYKEFNRWVFTWSDNGKRTRASFATEKEAFDARSKAFPIAPATLRTTNYSILYEVYNTQDLKAKSYLGITKRKPSSRMGNHRTHARKRMDDFHSHMADTGPLLWDMRVLYQFPTNEITREELLALEQVVIQSRDPSTLWNVQRIYGGIYAYWAVGSKMWWITKKHPDKEMEAEAMKFAAAKKAEHPSSPANYYKTYIGKIQVGGKEINSSSRNKDTVMEWLNEQVKMVKESEQLLASGLLKRFNLQPPQQANKVSLEKKCT